VNVEEVEGEYEPRREQRFVAVDDQRDVDDPPGQDLGREALGNHMIRPEMPMIATPQKTAK
jgi:hypothetical protein